METRRVLSTVVALMMTITVSIAQDTGIIPYHYTGYDNSGVQNLMQQHDGDFISKIAVSTPDGLRTVFYKLSSTDAGIIDTLSLFDESYQSHYYLFAKNPHGEGNVRVNAEPDGEGGTNLRISHFPDDDFIGDPSEDVVVPLCDREILDYPNLYMIDCRDDLIWKYHIPLTDTTYEGHMARFGLDGTLKHDALMPENQNFITHFGVLSEHPLKYYQWNGYNNLTLYVYDSLFQQENSYIINKGFHPEYDAWLVYFEFSNNLYSSPTFFIPDGDDVLVAAPYSDFSNGPGWPVYDFLETGTAVARYELRTMRQKGFVMFNDYPGPENSADVLCFFKTSNGSLYFIYRETVWDEHFFEISTPITVVKMAPDLNVLWTRYIDMPKDHEFGGIKYSVMGEDENEVKIAAGGSNIRVNHQTTPYTYTPGLLFFFLTDDDPLKTDEGEIKIRPYAFWPNPVQGRLSLKYSPDVQPQTIELYDLQGRLVRSQTTSLESLSMEGLAAGQYVMKVTMEDGKVFTDKVVKE